MPFYHHKKDLLLTQIRELIAGKRVPVIEIGCLTDKQHCDINDLRATHNLPKLVHPEVLYLGKHHINSRHSNDGYTAEDILLQIISAMDSDSIIPSSNRQTLITSIKHRDDGYGNQVIDTGVLELMARKPKAELFSVIPKGDTYKPNALVKKKTS